MDRYLRYCRYAHWYEKQLRINEIMRNKRERNVSVDCWKTKIGGTRRLVENECRSPEGTKFRRMNGAKQKSSEKKQMWEQIKSRPKGKCGWKIKSGGGETVRKVKHSSVRIENPIPALYRGTEYFSLARTFRTTWGGEAKTIVVRKKQTRPTQRVSLIRFMFFALSNR